MLLYTYPGERIWDINFGVGIEKYLFENNTPSLLETLRQRIVDQVSTYLPYLNLKNLEIDTDEINLNKISIRLEYEVAGFVDLVALEFRVDEPS
jgi:phage baseplate assembly protein W